MPLSLEGQKECCWLEAMVPRRVCPKKAFEGLELGEGKPSRPVLRGPGGRMASHGRYKHPEAGLPVL
jgi:hypothetical protein